MLDKLIEEVKEMVDSKDRVVERTIPLRKEWKKTMKEMQDAKDEAADAMRGVQKLMDKANTKKSAFWAQVESDLDDYSTSMRFNCDTQEIDIFARQEDE